MRFVNLPIPALYEQLAEECCELAQAALKLARIHRDENPTPIDQDQARRNLIEEFTDVHVAADQLGISLDVALYQKKLARWMQRCNQESQDLHTV